MRLRVRLWKLLLAVARLLFLWLPYGQKGRQGRPSYAHGVLCKVLLLLPFLFLLLWKKWRRSAVKERDAVARTCLERVFHLPEVLCREHVSLLPYPKKLFHCFLREKENKKGQ